MIRISLQNVELVKGHFTNAGVFQIVIGPNEVEKVYKEFVDLAGVETSNVSEVKSVGSQKLNPFQRLIKTFSDVFMPILPAIITAGLLMGINNLIGAEGLFIEGQKLAGGLSPPGGPLGSH